MLMITATEIDALLPQTQCTRCGYAGCMPYARAIAAGSAPINQCPPGGTELIMTLAALLGCAPRPLNPDHGAHSPVKLAWIDPVACIGCARCLPPCPVDAILGAPRYLHTVIAPWCTGCELCVSTCPVDCIHMVDWPQALPTPAAADNRLRYRAHEQRRESQRQERQHELAQLKQTATDRADRSACNTSYLSDTSDT